MFICIILRCLWEASTPVWKRLPENLGSNKLRRLWTITLPVVLPSIAAGAIMVFMTSLADFGTPMLIGEGYMVLPVLVYNEYMSEIGGNAHLASAFLLW